MHLVILAPVIGSLRAFPATMHAFRETVVFIIETLQRVIAVINLINGSTHEANVTFQLVPDKLAEAKESVRKAKVNV